MGRLLRRTAALAGALLLGITGLGLACWAPLFDAMAPRRIERDESVARPAPAPRRVVLVSIDGLAPRVMAETATPTLDRLAREGARAFRAHTVVPSITMTAHTTMLTGLPPEAHGVRWNRYQPWSRIPGPTLFSRCADAMLRCGLVAGKLKFARFAEEEIGARFYAYGPSAAEVLAAGAAWMRKSDGDFLMVHLAEVDLAGHEHGWGSGPERAAITALDGLLGGFLAEQMPGDRPLTLLVTSDHGGHATTHGGAGTDDVEIPWLLWGDGIAPGIDLGHGVSALDTGPTILAALGQAVPESWPGRPRFPAR